MKFMTTGDYMNDDDEDEEESRDKKTKKDILKLADGKGGNNKTKTEGKEEGKKSKNRSAKADDSIGKGEGNSTGKTTGVNFINILRLHFAPIFWRQKLQSLNATRESFKKNFCT